MITIEQLQHIGGSQATKRYVKYLDFLNDAMREFSISDNANREGMFIAQLMHESGNFRYVREIASGEAYEGREDLGNVCEGDGPRFRGRGLIQITGRDNYDKCGQALGLDLLDHPELLEEPIHATRSAAWFWQTKGLNEIADRGDFKLITKRINGGFNGWKERVAFYERAQQVLV